MSKVEELYAQARELSEAELQELVGRLCEMLRAHRRRRDRLATGQFSVGQLVRNTKGSPKLPEGAIGTIRHVNKVSLAVDFGLYGNWRISACFVEPAPNGVVMARSAGGAFPASA